jgi:hypothetical protein
MGLAFTASILGFDHSNIFLFSHFSITHLVPFILQEGEKLHIATSHFSIERTLLETWDWISQQVLNSLVTQIYVYHFSLTHEGTIDN